VIVHYKHGLKWNYIQGSDETHPYVVSVADDCGRVIHGACERYSDAETAHARAKILTAQGYNVSVFHEIGYSRV